MLSGTFASSRGAKIFVWRVHVGGADVRFFGRISITDEEDIIMAMVKCGRCKGTGKAFSENVCKGCGGDGVVQVPDPPTQCGRCKGTGKAFAENICVGCGGSGWAKG